MAPIRCGYRNISAFPQRRHEAQSATGALGRPGRRLMVLVHPARTAPLALLGSDCHPYWDGGPGTRQSLSRWAIVSSTERWRGCMYSSTTSRAGDRWVQFLLGELEIVLPVSGCPRTGENTRISTTQPRWFHTCSGIEDGRTLFETFYLAHAIVSRS